MDSELLALMDDKTDLSIRCVIGGYLVRYWAGQVKEEGEDGPEYNSAYQEQIFTNSEELAKFVVIYTENLGMVRNEAMAQRPLITNVLGLTFDGQKLQTITLNEGTNPSELDSSS